MEIFGSPNNERSSVAARGMDGWIEEIQCSFFASFQNMHWLWPRQSSSQRTESGGHSLKTGKRERDNDCYSYQNSTLASTTSNERDEAQRTWKKERKKTRDDKRVISLLFLDPNQSLLWLLAILWRARSFLFIWWKSFQPASHPAIQIPEVLNLSLSLSLWI